jgi:Tfp pilus assembly protein PilO
MGSLEQRERRMLIGAAVLGVIAALWYWVLPMYYRYGSLRQEIQNNVEKVRSAQTQAAQLKQLVNQLKTTKRELKLAKQKLPQQGRFNQLMSALEKHARNAGINARQIMTFNRGNVSTIKDGMLREMTIQTRFRGITMGELTDLLWRYDKMARMINVKNFQTANVQPLEDRQGIQFDLNLTLSVYMLQQDANESSGESA